MKKNYFLLSIGLLSSVLTFGQAVSVAGTHNWTDGTAWVGGVVPGSTETVIISAGTTMNLNAPLVHGADITVSNNSSFNSSNPLNTCTVNNGDVTLLGFGAIVNFLGSGAPVDFIINEGNLDNGGVFMVGNFDLTNTGGAGYSVNNGDFMAANVDIVGDLVFDNNLSMNVNAGSVTIDDSCVVNNANNINAADITNNGTLNNNSSVNASDFFDNFGSYSSNGNGTFIGTDFDNLGSANIQDSMDVGNDFSNSGTFSNDSGSVNIQNDFFNDGTVTGSGNGYYLISANSENDAAGTINGDINICDTTLSTQYLDVVAGTINYTTVTFCGVSYASAEEQELAQLIIYPNPTADYLTISGVEAGAVQIYSLDGKLLVQTNYTKNQQIDLNGLSEGVYVLKISTSKSNKTVSFVKR